MLTEVTCRGQVSQDHDIDNNNSAYLRMVEVHRIEELMLKDLTPKILLIRKAVES